METLSNQKRTMKPLFSTVPLVAENEPINLTLIPLFFTTKVHKGFSQRTQSANDVIAGNDPQSPVQRFVLGDSCFRRNDGVVLCVYFVLFVVKKHSIMKP